MEQEGGPHEGTADASAGGFGLGLVFVRKGHVGGAFLILLGFDSFLRTGELLSLIIADVVIDEGETGIVKLAHTKTGQRTAAYEATAINDPL